MAAQRVPCPVCNGTGMAIPLDEDFQRTGQPEPCIDCNDGWVLISA